MAWPGLVPLVFTVQNSFMQQKKRERGQAGRKTGSEAERTGGWRKFKEMRETKRVQEEQWFLSTPMQPVWRRRLLIRSQLKVAAQSRDWKTACEFCKICLDEEKRFNLISQYIEYQSVKNMLLVCKVPVWPLRNRVRRPVKSTSLVLPRQRQGPARLSSIPRMLMQSRPSHCIRQWWRADFIQSSETVSWWQEQTQFRCFIKQVGGRLLRESSHLWPALLKKKNFYGLQTLDPDDIIVSTSLLNGANG